MFTVISRIIQYGFKNFWRNIWLSAATIAIMVISLLVFIGLILFNVITEKSVASIQDKIDISVYFKTNAAEDEILNIKKSLEGLAEVKNIEYVSTDRALEIFKEKHKDDQTITQAISELNTNPLEASFNIKAHRPDQYAMIAEYLSASNLKNYIDTVSYAKNQIVIDRLTAIIQNVNRTGFALTVILTLIAGLVVFNTIRLAIYSNRDEIAIMRLVGASNSLVRGPYVVEGIVSGALAAILSIIIAIPATYFVSPYVEIFISDFSIFRYFYTVILSLAGYQLLFGVGVASVSAFVAVRRYLKN